MDTDSERLKQQFQALQEQQQKKVLRLKQRKIEKDKKEKVSKEKEKLNGLAVVDDDLGLSLAEPIKPEVMYNEELVTHLNSQLRELKDENGRLYKLLSERDYEIKKLKKQREDTKLAMTGGGVASETAATKIVDLSKKNRDLTAEVESEKNKCRQLLRKVNELERDLVVTKRQLPLDGDNKHKQMSAKQYVLGDTLEEKPAVDPAELKSLQDKISSGNLKMAEYRNQLQQLRQELKIAHKVIEKEVGDSVNIQSLLNTNAGGWRGRAQQITSLQNKVSELRSQLGQLQTRPDTEMSLEEQFMTMGTTLSPRSTAASSGYDDKNRSKIRQMEKERKEAKERAAAELKALEEDYSKMKEKFDASKARNKVLSNELKMLKQQMSTLMEKGKHDDELIGALMKQQTQMKQIIEENARLQEESQTQQHREVQQLQTKNIQDKGVVEQLKRIVSEKEQKVRVLEEEITQLKLNHQRTHMGDTSDRSSSRIPIARPNTVTLNSADRPPSVDSTRPSPQPPHSRQGTRPSSGSRDVPPRVPSARSIRPASASNNSTDQLVIQCQEYKSIAQAAEVERDKLMELVSMLQHRNDESNQKVTEFQSKQAELKQRNVQLEKQLGKARMEVANLSKSSGVKAKRTGSAVSSTVILDEDYMRSDLPQTQDNIEELQTRLAIQMDENDALKAALQSTMNAKEDDLKLYHEMMDQTRQVFLQGLRHFKQQNTS